MADLVTAHAKRPGLSTTRRGAVALLLGAAAVAAVTLSITWVQPASGVEASRLALMNRSRNVCNMFTCWTVAYSVPRAHASVPHKMSALRALNGASASQSETEQEEVRHGFGSVRVLLMRAQQPAIVDQSYAAI